MGIGASVFLLAAGAIITFALDVRVAWLDLDIVGRVLMACGAIGLIFSISLLSRRRRTVITPGPGSTADRRVVEDAPDYEDRPL